MIDRQSNLLRGHFLERFRHDWWANETLLDFLEGRAAGGTFAHSRGWERACHLFGHLLASELIWLGRVEESQDKMEPVWGARDLDELRGLYGRARSRWEIFLEALGAKDLSRVVSYENTLGQQYSNSLIQIIAHVLNHSTHHRAQVLAVLRGMDLEPPALDYMVYLRLPPSAR